MKKTDKKILLFDLWQTLIFGTKDSAISIFYKEITGEDIASEQLKKCMLIREAEPRRFLENFLHIVTPSNRSSMLLSLNNPRSPLYEKIVERFNGAVKEDLAEIRWMPGAIELLESLKKRYALVVVSNLWSYQKKCLYEKLNLGRYFDSSLFSCDIGMNKTEMLENIQKLAGADLSDMIYVGSSYEYDIIPAVNANLGAVRVLYENNSILPEKVEQMIDEEFSASSAVSKAEAPKKAAAKTSAVIVIPPFYRLLGSHNNRMNLGASYISAYLAAMGHDAKIYHCDFEMHENYATRYQMVFNSIDFYKELDSNPAFSEFEEFYRKDRRDVVFVTCGDILNPSFDSGNWDSAKKVAKIVRRANPGAFIVALGPELGRASEDFDLVVHGEAETLLEKIMDRKLRGVVHGELLPESKLRDFPIFNIKDVLTGISPVSLDTIIWRRGCVGMCDFCRVAQVNKGNVRQRPISDVIEEMKIRHGSLGVKNFYIVDANFTSDRRSVIELCKGLKKGFSDIAWRTESRFDTLDDEVLAEMKNAGCTHLKLGLENALHEKHQVRTKKVSIDKAGDRIKRIQDMGIKCVVYLMLGGKWFTPAQYRQMYVNAESLGADGYTVSLFNPYPNTPAGISFDEWEKRKFIGSHLDIRLVDFWKIPIDIVESFFALELKKGREDKDVRSFKLDKVTVGQR